MSDWIGFLNKYYKQMKAKNPAYKYKQAMVDAAKEFKKGSANAAAAAMTMPKTKKSTKKRSTKTLRRKRGTKKH